MKPLNFIFNSGALIFLLLTVGTALDSWIRHGEVCSGLNARCFRWGQDQPDQDKYMQCHLNGKKGDNDWDPDTPGTPIEEGKPELDPDGKAVCVCVYPRPKNEAGSTKGQVKCVEDKSVTANVEHGNPCDAKKGCRGPFKCHKDGVADKTGTKGDTQGTLIDYYSTETGVCICNVDVKYYHPQHPPNCRAEPYVKDGAAGHGAVCDEKMASTKCKGDDFTCKTKDGDNIKYGQQGMCECTNSRPVWKDSKCVVCPDDKPLWKNNACTPCPKGRKWDTGRRMCIYDRDGGGGGGGGSVVCTDPTPLIINGKCEACPDEMPKYDPDENNCHSQNCTDEEKPLWNETLKECVENPNPNPKPGPGSSGSDRIGYDPASLSLVMAALGSFLILLLSSA